MSLLIVSKDPKTGGIYAITNAVYKTNHGLIPYQGLSRIELQRFDNFILGYACHPNFARLLFEKIDFNKYPKDIDKTFIFKTFIPDILKVGLDSGFIELDDYKIFKRDNFEFFIIQKDKAFDICRTQVYEIAPGHFHVDDSLEDDTVVFGVMEVIYQKLKDTKQTLLQGFKELKNVLCSVGYPCYLYDSLKDQFYRIEENGEEIEIDMPNYWGK